MSIKLKQRRKKRQLATSLVIEIYTNRSTTPNMIAIPITTLQLYQAKQQLSWNLLKQNFILLLFTRYQLLTQVVAAA